MNSNILKTSYFVTQIRVDRSLDSSEERFQEDVVSVSGFTCCVWMEEQFLSKKCGFKNIWICIDVALEREGPQFQACNIIVLIHLSSTTVHFGVDSLISF